MGLNKQDFILLGFNYTFLVFISFVSIVDASIFFSNSSIIVQETVGPVSVCVQRAGADLSADLTINIQANDGPLANGTSTHCY